MTLAENADDTIKQEHDMPKMHTRIAFFDGRGRWSFDGEDHVTTTAHPDRYIHEDRGQYPSQQVRGGGRYTGATLTWACEGEHMGARVRRGAYLARVRP